MRKMQVVFVHGVANRKEGDGTAFERDVATRSQMLSKLTFGGKANVRNPYWGDLGGKLRYGGLCVPTEKDSETLGTFKTLEILGAPGVSTGPQANQLVRLGLRPQQGPDQPTGKELLIDAIVSGLEPAKSAEDTEYGATVQLLSDYAEHGDWSWLPTMKTDAELQQRLLTEIQAFNSAKISESTVEALGIGDFLGRITDGVKNAIGSVVDMASDAFMLKVKSSFTNEATKFVGDAFVYLNSRGKKDEPNEITKVALTEIEAAWEDAQKKGQKLILVGHSFGGTVLWDLLTYHRELLPKGFFADAVITGGTQVGLFIELDVYGEKLAVVPPTKVAKPSNLGVWINTFDFADPLGFQLEPMLEGAHDFQFNTGGSIINAHNLYFGLPSYYNRIKARLEEFKVI